MLLGVNPEKFDKRIKMGRPPIATLITLGKVVKFCREVAGLKQTTVASKLGYSDGWLSNLETGQLRPRRGQVANLEKAVDPDWRRRWAGITVPTIVYSGDQTLPGLSQAGRRGGRRYAGCTSPHLAGPRPRAGTRSAHTRAAGVPFQRDRRLSRRKPRLGQRPVPRRLLPAPGRQPQGRNGRVERVRAHRVRRPSVVDPGRASRDRRDRLSLRPGGPADRDHRGEAAKDTRRTALAPLKDRHRGL
jgi:transcriptional regulator with XRE-family HTH domain